MVKSWGSYSFLSRYSALSDGPFPRDAAASSVRASKIRHRAPFGGLHHHRDLLTVLGDPRPRTGPPSCHSSDIVTVVLEGPFDLAGLGVERNGGVGPFVIALGPPDAHEVGPSRPGT